MGVQCAGCDVKLGINTKTAHCAAGGCHRTFSTPALFDSHRRDGKCLDPARVRIGKGVKKGQPVFKMGVRGVWIGYRDPEEVVA